MRALLWVGVVAFLALTTGCSLQEAPPAPSPEPEPQIQLQALDITCPYPPPWWEEVIDHEDENHFPAGSRLLFQFLVRVGDPNGEPLPYRVHFYIDRLQYGRRWPAYNATNISLYDCELVEIGDSAWLCIFEWLWDGGSFIGPVCGDPPEKTVEYEVTWFLYDTQGNSYPADRVSLWAVGPPQ